MAMMAEAMALATGLYAATGMPVQPIAFAARSEVSHAIVELQDIADLSALPEPLRGRVSQIAIFRFGRGQDHMAFTAARAGERIRAMVPAMVPWLSSQTSLEIEVRLVGAPHAAPVHDAGEAGCMRVMQPVFAGSFPTTEDLGKVRCGPASVKALHYDASAGVVRASRDLAAGDIVVAVPDFSVAGVKPGQRIYVEARSGPVKVQRAMTAVQPARRGAAFFAKASDGTLMSVPYPSVAP